MRACLPSGCAASGRAILRRLDIAARRLGFVQDRDQKKACQGKGRRPRQETGWEGWQSRKSGAHRAD
jgi:hypothetical protein